MVTSLERTPALGYDTSPAPFPRPIRIGLLGLGQVGQAVVRLSCAKRDLFRRRGCDPRIVAVLVRDPLRSREVELPRSVVTDQAEQFLAGDFDVVIEVLGGVEPAGTITEHLLKAAVPVVTANKTLLAAQGTRLRRLATDHGTHYLREASVMAGVPILGTLQRRSLVADVNSLVGIFNGTSNHILSALGNGCPFTDALQRAKTLGLAESDPTQDIAGHDAAEKLVVVLHELGHIHVASHDIETRGIERLTPVDMNQAELWGGVIKPVVYADFEEDRIRGFVGPAFLSRSHPLAGIHGLNNGLCLCGNTIPTLFFSGPGAGPEVTAASILDDVIEMVEQGHVSKSRIDESFRRTDRNDLCEGTIDRTSNSQSVCVPLTSWFLRIVIPDTRPSMDDLCELLSHHEVWIKRSTADSWSGGGSVYFALTNRRSAAEIELALSDLHDATGCETLCIRSLED